MEIIQGRVRVGRRQRGNGHEGLVRLARRKVELRGEVHGGRAAARQKDVMESDESGERELASRWLAADDSGWQLAAAGGGWRRAKKIK